MQVYLKHINYNKYDDSGLEAILDYMLNKKWCKVYVDYQ